jgi:hypothetical protein
MKNTNPTPYERELSQRLGIESAFAAHKHHAGLTADQRKWLKNAGISPEAFHRAHERKSAKL